MPKLTLDINCGDTTCASSPGKFCRFLLTQKFGQVPVCQFFSRDIGRGKLEPLPNSREDGLGWTLRHPDCLSASI